MKSGSKLNLLIPDLIFFIIIIMSTAVVRLLAWPQNTWSLTPENNYHLQLLQKHVVGMASQLQHISQKCISGILTSNSPSRLPLNHQGLDRGSGRSPQPWPGSPEGRVVRTQPPHSSFTPFLWTGFGSYRVQRTRWLGTKAAGRREGFTVLPSWIHRSLQELWSRKQGHRGRWGGRHNKSALAVSSRGRLGDNRQGGRVLGTILQRRPYRKKMPAAHQMF